MSEQKSLWDHVEEKKARERARDALDRREVQVETIKRLRANSVPPMVAMKVAGTLRQPFRLNDLSVACFAVRPDLFAMQGYPQFPDNHKVHWILYGDRGLVSQGFLRRVSKGLFQVPDDLDPATVQLIRDFDLHSGQAPG
jgi:hypothetical protein